MPVVRVILHQVNVHVCQADQVGVVINVNMVIMVFQTA
jgi:hypothetical protein